MNSPTLGAMTLLFGELLRTCQQEIIHLAGADHGLAFRRRLIKIVQESNVVAAVPDNHVKDVRSAVSLILDNIIRVRNGALK